MYKDIKPFPLFQVILIVSWAKYEPLTKGDYEYPGWANAIGWIIAMTAILAVPVVAVYQIVMKVFVEYKDLAMREVRLMKFIVCVVSLCF